MRRALLAITGLAAGTTALVVLKGAPEAGPVAQELPVTRPPVVPSGTAPGRTAAPTPASAAPAGVTATPKPRPTATRTPGSRTGTSARPTSAPRTTAAPPKSTTRTVTGSVVSNEYGNVQVQITLSGTRIVDVVALELPQETAQSDRRSEEVDGRYGGTAGQVVRKQSADLDTVSGATVTSTSYRQSLQAALDRAR
ncbi:FMN-binding protein [Micromonospora rubida]|uniref:FMN-binding protein n=1 Tax=Micromonospora rubida TaxID=2697657 RepID=UPI00137807EE|nr:FMN-binding protein [Micromonospora rubida]NBE85342.1 FMN-binding protein [Micromonospora rubida]